MGDIVKSVVVNAPIQRVYAYVSDAHNAPSFISSISAILSGPDGVPKVGDTWRADANFMGKRRAIDLRLTELRPPERVRFVISGDPHADLLLRLASIPAGTRVSLKIDVPAAPSMLLAAVMGGLLQGDMSRLKAALE